MRRPIAALSLLATAVLAQRRAGIYITPSPTYQSLLGEAPIENLEVSPVEANIVLAHHLGLSAYERTSLVDSKGSGSRWATLWGLMGLDEAGATKGEADPWASSAPKDTLLLVIQSNDADAVQIGHALGEISRPTMVMTDAPSTAAFDALIATYLTQFAEIFGIHLSSIRGFQEFSTHAQGVRDWLSGQVSDGLFWASRLVRGSARVEQPIKAAGQWLNQLDFLSDSASTGEFVAELNQIDHFVESLSARREARSSVSAMRFQALSKLEAELGSDSSEFKQARSLFEQILTAAKEAYARATNDAAQVITMVVPRDAKPRHNTKITRRALVQPFSTHPRRGYSKRQDDDKPAPSTTPVVASYRSCYDSQSSCENSTSTCNGHGSCVSGVQYGKTGCWTCACSPTTEDGKTTVWSGETCQKMDISSPFVLLAGITIVLILSVAASVVLLYQVGEAELPSTLAAVGGLHKRE
ncbi:uncharacterized protein L969DRAFT_19353 [Mixia osmundae IAM 14324]|uniref:Vacuolar sorting protein Vps3844 C-terminal domain-containing protein n=1 Tax=Mixia osmundae (strain CBS 9802 / IAM 14324 / JCM 22182 / KY 12970) TaxID=764103 RepID=G7DX59_MIXOS|nr:uncharacterized protein L969DRAFT_19353 [Mixia osmundae IAM 14324]KEI37306.1 hypothetical protein L969DRAFT_19353 [Mixia osmundae IAM 14324]GAA95169.1 hypothetical protein E5Q_01824 [Mixia osmundae IAM 14324]